MSLDVYHFESCLMYQNLEFLQVFVRCKPRYAVKATNLMDSMESKDFFVFEMLEKFGVSCDV